MLKIETPVQEVKASQEAVYAFMADMNNLEKLMPEQVINWKSDSDTCSYTIKGMADIRMKMESRKPSDQLVMQSEGGPFPFKLTLNILPSGSHASAAMVFEGEVNPFLKMMVEKPLKNFFSLLVSNLAREFAS